MKKIAMMMTLLSVLVGLTGCAHKAAGGGSEWLGRETRLRIERDGDWAWSTDLPVYGRSSTNFHIGGCLTFESNDGGNIPQWSIALGDKQVCASAPARGMYVFYDGKWQRVSERDWPKFPIQGQVSVTMIGCGRVYFEYSDGWQLKVNSKPSQCPN